MPTDCRRPEAPLTFSSRALARARSALGCLPFCLQLFVEMRDRSVPLPKIAGGAGLERGYTTRALAELVAEDHLMWLINVGLLRREVDGQGLTDSFRLTPLGREIVAAWEATGALPQPSPWQRYRNWADRRLRLPFIG